MKFLTSIILTILALFTLVMIALRFMEGSFEAAGERMDRWLGQAADEAEIIAEDVAERTEAIIEDVRDGADEPVVETPEPVTPER